jgi:streptogramin lyase
MLLAVFTLGGGVQNLQAGSLELSGTVSSADEGNMEGVLVSAKGEGSSITMTVISGKGGVYSFPAGRLVPGRYHLKSRAVGYDLEDPGPITIAANQPAHVDLKLHKTKDLSAQLTSAEWLMSVPGNPDQKEMLYRCVHCHDLGPIVHSTYDEKGWLETLVRMEGWLPPSTISHPIKSPTPVTAAPDADFAKYLSTINLNGRFTWTYTLKTLARPTGEATRVIITEYDLPGPSVPHDVAVGSNGIVWYNDFQRPLLGRLDTRTAATKEWLLPVLKPEYPQGFLTLKLDKNGDVWIPRFFQGCTFTKFETKTEKFVSWTVAPKYNNSEARCGHVALGAPDGTIWFSDSGNRRMFKLNPANGHIDAYPSFPNYAFGKDSAIETAGRNSHGHRTYGIAVDSLGNGYFADISGGTIGEVNAETGKVTLYPTPTPDSGPRRMFMDSQDRLWFGENYASKLGMFDSKSKQIREWTPPVPWSGPYPATEDKDGKVWTVGMPTDYVYRLDPATNQFTAYLLPCLGCNLRRVDSDNSTTPPTIWTAEVHGGKLAKIELRK